MPLSRSFRHIYLKKKKTNKQNVANLSIRYVNWTCGLCNLSHALSVSLWTCFASYSCRRAFPAQLYTWGMSQQSCAYSSSKVTVWCDFQRALPLQLTPASSPRESSFTPNLGRHGSWNWGSRGRRWRVNVCWHSSSLPLRQSGVWI